jgi:hypothetical protein
MPILGFFKKKKDGVRAELKKIEKRVTQSLGTWRKYD